jgi:hypothetical protein
MANIYETRAAQKDARYKDWITSVNYVMLMNTGAPIHGNAALSFLKMRRWYLAGLSPYEAAMRLNTTGARA